MSERAEEKADYGNWVSKRLIFMPGLLFLVFGGLCLWFPLFGIVSALCLICSLYFMYARCLFSSRGRDIQTKVQSLVLDHIMEWNGVGKVLDIGCGNGSLTIRIAKGYRQAQVNGIDYWGKAWEYSKRVCERNAEIEKVAERVIFEKASASSLPFDDEAFDGVVSNLVFHEVRSVRDKRILIKEALRVVKKGGWFVFQDLLLWKSVYGEVNDLLETIRSWEIEKVGFDNTSDSDFIPKVLRLPFMLGTVGILYGRK